MTDLVWLFSCLDYMPDGMVFLPFLLLWISVEKQPIMVSKFFCLLCEQKIKKTARDIPLKYVVEPVNGFNSKLFPVLLMI